MKAINAEQWEAEVVGMNAAVPLVMVALPPSRWVFVIGCLAQVRRIPGTPEEIRVHAEDICRRLMMSAVPAEAKEVRSGLEGALREGDAL